MSIRRLTRLTNAHSKSWKHHAARGVLRTVQFCPGSFDDQDPPRKRGVGLQNHKTRIEYRNLRILP
jgi:hypothetical protein